eukprot:6149897-Prymnesium_polylepis.5
MANTCPVELHRMNFHLCHQCWGRTFPRLRGESRNRLERKLSSQTVSTAGHRFEPARALRQMPEVLLVLPALQ